MSLLLYGHRSRWILLVYSLYLSQDLDSLGVLSLFSAKLPNPTSTQDCANTLKPTVVTDLTAQTPYKDTRPVEVMLYFL